MAFEPTAEQIDAIDAFETGENTVVQALAGSGKTSTLKLMSKAAKPMSRGLYLAYNKSIATEAAASFPRNTQCRTAHSFAFGAVGKKYAHRLNGPRISAETIAYNLGIKDKIVLPDGNRLSTFSQARMVMDAVTQFCYSADKYPQPKHVKYIQGLDSDTFNNIAEFIANLANVAWADLTRLDGALRFSHDCYLKMWSMTTPRLNVDFVHMDEAQDINPCVEHVIMNQNDTQIILVGDTNQAIYAWRGAEDALDRFPAEHICTLSQSFRFGPAIAAEANKWLTLLNAPMPITGYDEIASTVGPVNPLNEDGIAILCRTNAEAMVNAMAAHEGNRSFSIVGGTKEIKDFAVAAGKLQAGQSTEHPELFAFKNWAAVQKFVAEDATDLRKFVDVIDSHGPQRVIEVADAAMDEKQKLFNPSIIISTAHKSKGREWDTVKIADDFVEPEPDEETGEKKDLNKSEMQLLYVAITRAKNHLDCESVDWVNDRLKEHNV